ncbi:MAG: hypothetical protein Q8O00_13305 [Holophaga sp.]|nr:hypothetical protein [Holophaga sp.]
MIAITCQTTQVGDMIAAEYDRAALSSSDPIVVSHLATRSIARLLRGAFRVAMATPPLGLRFVLVSGLHTTDMG